METKVIMLPWVQDFIDGLEFEVRQEMHELIYSLKSHGHRLSMPEAKPIGGGLWELRLNSSAAYRILYGFCEGEAVLLLGFKKQRSAIFSKDFNLAKKRLRDYCL